MASRGRGRPRATEGLDLRTQLLRVGRELLDEGGTTLLSLREVARRVGCTHQAPYHYFPNRESLLAALVAEGFGELAQQLQAAHSGGSQEAVLERSANAYIEFALRNPGQEPVLVVCEEAAPEAVAPPLLPEEQAARTGTTAVRVARDRAERRLHSVVMGLG